MISEHPTIPTFTVDGPLRCEGLAEYLINQIEEGKINPQQLGWVILAVTGESASQYGPVTHDLEVIDDINEALWKLSSEWKVSWLQCKWEPESKILEYRILLDLVGLQDIMRV